MARAQLCWCLQPEGTASVTAVGPKIIGFGPTLLSVKDISHSLNPTEQRWERAAPVICYRYKRGFKCMKVRDTVLPFPFLLSVHIATNNRRGLFLKYSFM